MESIFLVILDFETGEDIDNAEEMDDEDGNIDDDNGEVV